MRWGQPIPAQLIEHAKRTEALGRFDRSDDVLFGGDVRVDERAVDFLRDAFAFVVLQIRHDDFRAALGQQPSGRLAEARRSTRDDR